MNKEAALNAAIKELRQMTSDKLMTKHAFKSVKGQLLKMSNPDEIMKYINQIKTKKAEAS